MDGVFRATTKTPAGDIKGRDSWQVTVRRYGQRLSRTFPEARWGGREAALAAAQDWRDAIMDAIPPIINQHAATRLGTCNTTGISGVLRSVPRNHPAGMMWVATLTARNEQKKRAFSVAAYGEEGAPQPCYCTAPRVACPA